MNMKHKGISARKLKAHGIDFRDVAYSGRSVITNRYGLESLTPIRLDPTCGRAKYRALCGL